MENKETLEEAAERIYQEDFNTPYLEEVRRKNIKDAMIKLAKWQAERMYSEEDMRFSFEAGIRKSNSSKKHSECWQEWIEQFKRNNYE